MTTLKHTCGKPAGDHRSQWLEENCGLENRGNLIVEGSHRIETT
jgi:hypothetical protein